LAPTWDKSPQWLASMMHLAREGRMFVISVCQALHREHVPDRFAFKDVIPLNVSWITTGNSVIVDPESVILIGPCYAKQNIISDEINHGKTKVSRGINNAAGHYSRLDMCQVFKRKPAADARPGVRRTRATRRSAARAEKPSRRGAARKRTTKKRRR